MTSPDKHLTDDEGQSIQAVFFPVTLMMFWAISFCAERVWRITVRLYPVLELGALETQRPSSELDARKAVVSAKNHLCGP